MKIAPLPENESQRLSDLLRLEILDTPSEERFDRITQTAKQVFDIPIALISVVDANREWFKSCIGLPLKEAPRSISFCSHTILENEPLVIPDSLEDERFFDNPLVINSPYIRFYAGVPVSTGNGVNIGTLCLIDTKPRKFSTKDIELLKNLGKWVELEINSRNISLVLETLKTKNQEINRSLDQQELLAKVADLLNKQTDPQKTLNQVLKSVGEYTGVSRIYIFEDSIDGKNTSNTFEWCNQGTQPQIKNLQAVDYTILPSFKKIIDTRGKLFSTDISQLPDDVYQILKPQQIKSIIIFPLTIFNKFKGFIGFDECNFERNWTQSEINLLNTISSMVSNYYQRNSLQSQIEKDSQRLAYALEGAGDGLWDWNLESNEVFFSKRWKQMLGFKDSEIKNSLEEWSKRVHPEDLKETEKLIKQHISGKTKKYQSIHRVKCKNGEYKWILDRGKVTSFDKSGKPLRMVGTHTDLTSQRQAELELKKSSELLKSTFHSLDDLVFLLDKHNRFMKLDQGPKKYFISSKKFIGKHITKVMPAKISLLVTSAIKKVKKYQQTELIEYSLKYPDGIHWFSAKISPRYGVDNQFDGVTILARDVTENKKLNSQLEELSLVASKTSNMVIICDAQGKTIWVNHAFEATTGYTLKEIMGKKPGDLLQGKKTNSETIKYIAKTIAQMKPFKADILNYTKDNVEYWTRLNITPIFDQKGKIDKYISVQEIISEDKRIQQAKDEFLSIASHQLRTPLTSIRWFLEMLLAGDLGDLSDEQKEGVSQAYASNNRMIELVGDLLNISRIESGGLIINPEKVHLEDFLDSVVHDLHTRLEEKNIILKKIYKQVPKYVVFDSQLMRHVYVNLITNAIKYSPEKSIIKLTLQVSNGQLISTIQDQGFGIPKEQQSRVFDKFFRGNNIVKKVTDGSGLGLYLVKSVIELSGGEIWFTSDESTGTKFSFKIPSKTKVKKKGNFSLT